MITRYISLHHYQLADWDSFCNYFLCDSPWLEVFTLPINWCASEITERILAGDASSQISGETSFLILVFTSYCPLKPLFPSLVVMTTLLKTRDCSLMLVIIARQSFRMLRKIINNLLKQRSQCRNLILVTSRRFSTVFQTRVNLQSLLSLVALMLLLLLVTNLSSLPVHLLVSVLCLSLINIFLSFLLDVTLLLKTYGLLCLTFEVPMFS